MNYKAIVVGFFGVLALTLLALALTVPVRIILFNAVFTSDQCTSAVFLGVVGVFGSIVAACILTPDRPDDEDDEKVSRADLEELRDELRRPAAESGRGGAPDRAARRE